MNTFKLKLVIPVFALVLLSGCVNATSPVVDIEAVNPKVTVAEPVVKPVATQLDAELLKYEVASGSTADKLLILTTKKFEDDSEIKNYAKLVAAAEGCGIGCSLSIFDSADALEDYGWQQALVSTEDLLEWNYRYLVQVANHLLASKAGKPGEASTIKLFPLKETSEYKKFTENDVYVPSDTELVMLTGEEIKDLTAEEYAYIRHLFTKSYKKSIF